MSVEPRRVRTDRANRRIRLGLDRAYGRPAEKTRILPPTPRHPHVQGWGVLKWGMNLLIFAGSTRRDSLNRKLATASADLARHLTKAITHIELSEFDLPMYNGDLEAQRLPADVIRLKQLALAHPAWIICSPEYNGTYPALLKNTLDWLSRPVPADATWGDGLRPTRGKVVGVLSASPGALGGLRAHPHLAALLLTLKCWVAPTGYALSHADSAFDDQGHLINAAARQGVQAVIDQVVTAATRLNSDSPPAA